MKNVKMLLLLLVFVFISAYFFYHKKEIPFNVLLITIDTLRADHLGYHGYQRNTSPFIDSFSKKSTIFMDASAQVPKTLPSIVSLMASQYADTHGILSNPHILSKDALILSEVLKKYSSSTVAYTTGTLIKETGIAQGFDEYYFLDDAIAENITQKAINRLKKGFSEKFFLWLHYIDPHGPYTPPPPYNESFVNDKFYDPLKKVNLEYEPMEGYNQQYVLGAVPEYQLREHKENSRKDETDFYISQYDGEIRYLDDQIKELIEYLEKNGYLQNTIIIFTSDHGEGLGEHNYYFDHGWFVYQHEIHVPLLIYFPDQQIGKVVKEPVQLIDVAPTILNRLNIPIPEAFQGKNLTPPFKDNKSEAGFVYSQTPKEYPHMYKTLRLNKWKYIIDDKGTEELYDLQNDRVEKKNVINENNEIALFLKSNILKGPWAIKNSKESKVLSSKDLNKKIQKNLKSLGYLN